MQDLYKLSQIPANQTFVIHKVNCDMELKYRLFDMGLVKNTQIKKIKAAPLGDPIEFELRGYRLSLRFSDAEKITVSKLT